MHFDELKVEDSCLLRFISESEIGTQDPCPMIHLPSQERGRMAGHMLHSTHVEVAPGDGRGWYGRVVRAGPCTTAGAKVSELCMG
jgi:hypothetical protein